MVNRNRTGTMDSGRGAARSSVLPRCLPGSPASTPRTLEPEKTLTQNGFSWTGRARWWGVSHLRFQQACAAGVHHPTLQMGKARFREIKHFPQGHTALLERTRPQTHSWLLPSVQWPPAPTPHLLPLLLGASCVCSPRTSQMATRPATAATCHMVRRDSSWPL